MKGLLKALFVSVLIGLSALSGAADYAMHPVFIGKIQVAEADDGIRHSTAQLDIGQPAALPDLSVVGYLDANIVEGYLEWFFVEVFNLGGSRSGPYSVYVYVDGAKVCEQRDSDGLQNGSDYSFAFTCQTPAPVGTHTLRLVADAKGEVSESNESNNEWTSSFTASPRANQPPVAIIQVSDTNVPQGTAITFSASGSYDPDPGDTIVRYRWYEDVGSGYVDLSTSVSFTKSDFSIGTHRILLTVTDNHNLTSDSVGVSVTINLVATPVPTTPASPYPTVGNMRKNRAHYAIRYAGNTYHAWQVVDVSDSLPPSNNPEDVYTWASLKTNWLILDSNGALPRDEFLYSSLAWDASIAHCLATGFQCNPENMLSAARTNDLLGLSAYVADSLYLYNKIALIRVKSLIPLWIPSLAPLYSSQSSVIAGYVCSVLNLFSEVYGWSLHDEAVYQLRQGSEYLRNGANAVSPTVGQLNSCFPSCDGVIIDHEDLSLFYNHVYNGWGASNRGRWMLSASYNADIVAYLRSVAAGLAPGVACVPDAVLKISRIATSPPIQEFIEKADITYELFDLWEDKFKEGAMTYHRIFSLYGIPSESGVLNPVIQLSQPDLRPGSTGDASTVFTFSVKYYNLANWPPSDVRLVLNGLPIAMSKADPSDQNYVDGVIYTWSSRLEPGKYFYYFEASSKTGYDSQATIELGLQNNYGLEVRPLPMPLIVANPARVPLDGVSTSTITVTLRDIYGHPVIGQEVWFSANKSFTFNPGSATTNENGIVTTRFLPDESGDTIITAFVGHLGSAQVTVHAYPVPDAYLIQLAAIPMESTSTYKRYMIWPVVSYASNGERVYGKTLILTTDRGTFQNGLQEISVDLLDGQPYGPNSPPYITVTSEGNVTVVGALEASSSSITFNVILSEILSANPVITIPGNGWLETDHEVSWSPDGRYLATSGSAGGVFNVLTWQKVATLRTCEGDPPRVLEFSPTGAFLAMASTYKAMSVFRTSDWTSTLCVRKEPLLFTSISWSDDETMLAVITDRSTIQILNTTNGATVRTLTVPSSTIHGDERLFSLDWQGTRLAAGGETGIAYIWDTSSWSLIASYDLMFRQIESVRWSPNGNYVAFAGKGLDDANDVAFLSSSGALIRKVVDPGGETVNSIDWSPDSTKVVLTNDSGVARILDMSGNILFSLQSAGNVSVAWSSTDLIAAANDGMVSIYAPYDHSGPSIAVGSPYNNYTTASITVTVRGWIFDPSGIKSASIQANSGLSTPIALAADGSFQHEVVLQDGSNTILIWATDNANNTGSFSIVVHRSQTLETVSTTFYLLPGWNLVSFPLLPTNVPITQALSSIAGKCDLIYTYEATDSTDPWKKYDARTLAPPFLNDLVKMDGQHGYWIRISSPAELTMSGVMTTGAIRLQPGWNLVSYPALVTKPIRDALASCEGKYDLVYGYYVEDDRDHWKKYDVNAPTNLLNDLIELIPGKGYWIRATQACEWAP